MHPQSIKARSTPYPTRKSRQRVCGYCGTTTQAHTHDPDYYCADCRPLAIQLGWIQPGHGTYVCERCGEKKRGTSGRTLCGQCTWNTGKGRNR